VTRLDDRLAALGNMSPDEVRAEWERAREGTAPKLPVGLLRLLVAHGLQEKRWGSVPAVILRELQRAAAGAETSPPPPAAAVLRPGTRLVREWQGRQVDVLVTEDGFVWEERSYPSLSAIARAVTGAHWSGPRFFGIVGRG
jgi:hypothetical protein